MEAHGDLRYRGSHILYCQLTDGAEVVSLTRRPCFTPQKYFMVLISVTGLVNPRARLKQLNKFKKCSDFIGNRTSDLPVRSTPSASANYSTACALHDRFCGLVVRVIGYRLTVLQVQSLNIPRYKLNQELTSQRTETTTF
jgi:hypothetical protein